MMQAATLFLVACSAVAGSARELGAQSAGRRLLAPMQDCCCSMDGKTCLPAASSKTNGACASTVPMAKMCGDADLGYTGAGKTPMMPNSGSMPAANAGSMPAGNMPMPAGNMPMPAAGGSMPAAGNSGSMPMPMPAAGMNNGAMAPGMMKMAQGPAMMPMMNGARAPMMGPMPMPMMNNARAPTMPMPMPMPNMGGGSAAGR